MSKTTRRAAVVLILAIVSAILSSSLVAPVGAQRVTQAKYPTSYHLVVYFLDFRDADHSANISIHFDAQFAMASGAPGVFGLNLAIVARETTLMRRGMVPASIRTAALRPLQQQLPLLRTSGNSCGMHPWVFLWSRFSS